MLADLAVVVGSLTTDRLDGLKGVTPMAVDLASPDGPGQLIQRAVANHGRIDVLVNNVGAVRMRLEGFLATSDEDFAWAMQNFFIALPASRAALTAMVERGSGAIVNVAAKAALVNLTKALSQEFGSGRTGSASTRSRPARWLLTCGWAS